jgi:hypothetical protein
MGEAGQATAAADQSSKCSHRNVWPVRKRTYMDSKSNEGLGLQVPAGGEFSTVLMTVQGQTGNYPLTTCGDICGSISLQDVTASRG